MIVLQLILSLIIPAVLIVGGRRYIKDQPAYGEKRFLRFHSKRAAASEEAWHFVNNLYAHMLYGSGLSIGGVTVIFFLVASHYVTHRWILCISLIIVQIVGSIVLPALTAYFMLRRMYDKDGLPTEPDPDDEEEQEENAIAAEGIEVTQEDPDSDDADDLKEEIVDEDKDQE